MKAVIAFWNILKKDINHYYLKPPNISWGLIFPVAWTLMFFLRSKEPVDIHQLLPGVMAIAVLFGTTSMLAVTITFERRSRSFERLLVAPISLNLLILSKTLGAVIFGVFNALVPLLFASFFVDLGGINWPLLGVGVILIAVTSTFFGLFIAVSVSEVFEAQTFSNFFRFPMVFLCGLFVPVADLPVFIRPLSYLLPLTYGVDLLRWSVLRTGNMPTGLSLLALFAFVISLFAASMRNVRRRWIL